MEVSVTGHGDALSRGLLKGVSCVHIVGIGGISMSAIAKILVERGFRCTGSDKTYNDNCADVEAIGVKVFIGHEASNISDQGLVIYTAAVNESIPEIVRAKELGIPVVGRAKFLGELMEEYENSIAVSGAHGKTSTTSMIAHILADIADPTVLVGGLLSDNHSNVMIGKSDTFVHEACEFKDTFLSLRPKTSVILNIDADHLDYFSGIEAIVASFRKFAYGTKERVVYFADDPWVRKAVEGLDARYGGNGHGGGSGDSARLPKAVSFGTSADADYRVTDLERTAGASAKFRIEKDGACLAEITLSAHGFINWVNAAAAFACCMENMAACGTPRTPDTDKQERAAYTDKQGRAAYTDDQERAAYIAGRLASFANAGRRFEIYGTYGGVTVVDDFAHHPNEIEPALETAAAVSGGRVIALFQPYTYSRTKELLQEFGRCFKGVDELVVSDILGGREVDPGDIHARDVVRVARECGVSAHLSDTLENAGDLAVSLAGEGDMIITLGCGNVYLAARYMDRKLRSSVDTGFDNQ